MRARPAPVSPLYPKIRFAFTDHPITIWAGAIVLRLYFELLGLRMALTRVLTPLAKTSNNQIPSVDVLLAWWYGLALGAERFAHMTRYRRDPLLPRLLGVPRFPSPDTLRPPSLGSPIRRLLSRGHTSPLVLSVLIYSNNVPSRSPATPVHYIRVFSGCGVDYVS